MKDSQSDRLFNQICLGDRYTALQATSMNAGLASLRRVRRQKQLTRVAAFACVPLLLFLTFRYRPAPHAPSGVSTASQTPLAQTTLQPAATKPAPTGIKVIGEAEFLELLERYPGGQSVALIARPGQQPIVLLGNPEPDYPQ